VTRNAVLALVLILSIITNVFFINMALPEGEAEQMQSTIERLEEKNAELTSWLSRYNGTMQKSDSQLAFYRQKVEELESQLHLSSDYAAESASMQAPVIIEHVINEQSGPFERQGAVEEGSMVNISAEIAPGKGRVLVQTTPLMGIVFQDAANTAVYVAENVSGIHLNASDVIFSIKADSEISSIDGPSAGALMAALLLSSMLDRSFDENITMTGTIDEGGQIGEISGVIKKAEAAHTSGKTLLILPRANSRTLHYTEQNYTIYGFTVEQQVPEFIDTKRYIEENIGIRVEFVDTIEDTLEYAR